MLEDAINKAKAQIRPTVERMVADGLKKYSTGAVRETLSEDPRYDLLPRRAMRELAIHFGFGAEKYGDRNWEAGIPLSVMVNHLEQHLGKMLMGDHSERHDRAVAWNAMALLDMVERLKDGSVGSEVDDIGWIDDSEYDIELTEEEGNRVGSDDDFGRAGGVLGCGGVAGGDAYPVGRPMRVAYLMSPIDFADDGHAGMKSEAVRLLGERGFVVYDPAAAWSVPWKDRPAAMMTDPPTTEPDGRLWHVNTAAMHHSDCGLAILPKGTMTLGVPMEIQEMAGKVPVAVVTNVQGSFALAGSAAQLFCEPSAAVEWLAAVVGLEG